MHWTEQKRPAASPILTSHVFEGIQDFLEYCNGWPLADLILGSQCFRNRPKVHRSLSLRFMPSSLFHVLRGCAVQYITCICTCVYIRIHTYIYTHMYFTLAQFVFHQTALGCRVSGGPDKAQCDGCLRTPGSRRINFCAQAHDLLRVGALSCRRNGRACDFPQKA